MGNNNQKATIRKAQSVPDTQVKSVHISDNTESEKDLC